MKLMCLIAAPEGIAAVHSVHQDVPIYTAAVDSHLDENAYIVPGRATQGIGSSAPSEKPYESLTFDTPFCTSLKMVKIDASVAGAGEEGVYGTSL